MAQRNHRYFSVIVEPEDEPGDDGPPVPGYGASVGDVLRHARQQTGYALSDVAEVLRIRLRYLEAIEDGRFDDLPGSVYAVGFIRAYAEFLGLDTDEMVRRFKDEVAGIDRQTELHFPEPVAEGRVPGGAILLIAVVLAAVAYGGWFYMSSDKRSFDEMVPQMPERFAALLSSEPAVEPPSDTPAGAGTALPEAPSETAGTGTGTPSATGSTGGPAAGPDSDPAADPAADPGARGTELADVGEIDVPAPSIVPPAAEGGEAPAAPVAAPTTASPADAGGATAADTAGPSGAAEDSSGAPGPATAGSPAGPAAEVAAADGTAPSAAAPSGDAGGAADAEGAADTAAAQGEGASGTADGASDGLTGGPDAGETAATPPRPGASAAQAAADSTAQVVLQATADSWVQVRDGSGNLVMTRVLRPGDVYEVPDMPGLTLVTGNAGGLDILVDGRTVPPLGEQGEVVRDISLDARTLLNGNP